jgi:TonB family protein
MTAMAGAALRPSADHPAAQTIHYLLPPQAGEVRGPDERLQWLAVPADVGRAERVEPTGKRDPTPIGGRPSMPGPPPPPPPASEDPDAGQVFVMSQVAKAAERNPSSAAPAYPAYLEQVGIEGYATVEFVVDTVGRPDRVSFRVIEATNPAFAESVRAALPGMLFTPAEIDGQHVRQLVRQTFQFVIKRPDGQLART